MQAPAKTFRATLVCALTAGAGLAGLAALTTAARAADKVTFLTSWFAQVEHGGFYQAKATGLYDKAGLDVTIKMGGPQVNGMQLLLAGETDVMMGYDFSVLKALEQGFPVVTIGTSFQFDLQGMMTHDDVASLSDLKDKTILVATPGRTTWWPWMKAKYNYSDEQTKPYTFNLQPFFADRSVVQQAYPSSEPFQAKKQGMPVKFFLFARDGYPPYGTTMVANRGFVEKNPDAAARFVKAGLRHIIFNSATPIDDGAIQLVQILFRNDREEDCSTQELIDWDAAIIAEDRDILESTDPDAVVDMDRKIEMHMPSDRPGILMRKRLNALLAEHGEVEVPR